MINNPSGYCSIKPISALLSVSEKEAGMYIIKAVPLKVSRSLADHKHSLRLLPSEKN